MVTRFKRIGVVFPRILVVLLLLSGCDREDLRQVQAFAKNIPLLKEQAKTLSTDIYSSCIRATKIDQDTAALDTAALPGPPRQTRFPPIEERERIKQGCDPWLKVTESFYAFNLITLDYMEALGNLATDNPIAVDQRVGEIGAALNSPSAQSAFTRAKVKVTITPQTIQDASIITGVLSRIYLNRIQRENIKPAIICTDPYFQEQIQRLSNLTDEISVAAYGIEENEITEYFDTKYSSDKTDPRQVVSLTNDYNLKIMELDKKLGAAKSYRLLLGQAGKAHSSLAAIFREGSPESEVKALCKDYFKEDSQLKSDRRFNSSLNSPLNSPPSEEQLRQAKKVFLEYAQATEPLLEKLKDFSSH